MEHQSRNDNENTPSAMKQHLLFFLTLLLSPFIWAQKPTVQIILTGSNIQYWPVHSTYEDSGFVAIDSAFNNYDMYVITTGNIDTSILGTYQLVYSIADSIANATPVTRTVTIVDDSPPVIQLLGPTVITNYDSLFEEPGYILSDNYYPESTLKLLITIAHSANIKVDGSGYILLDKGPGWVSYHLTDPAGNVADSAVRFFGRIIRPGMAELANTSFTIYPNPAFDIITIKSDIKIDRCLIMDALGNIAPLTVEQNASGLQVNVSEFANGMYTIMIESSEQRHFLKVVLTHPR